MDPDPLQNAERCVTRFERRYEQALVAYAHCQTDADPNPDTLARLKHEVEAVAHDLAMHRNFLSALKEPVYEHTA
jgi:hypothetical protein